MPTRKPINLRKAPTVRKDRIKHSKRVLDRLKATTSLLGRLETARERAAAGFSQKLAAELRNGEVMPDQALALDLVGRSVKTAVDFLKQADNKYCSQAVRRRRLADACQHVASKEIYPEMVDVRRSIETRFGLEAGRHVHHIDGHTRRKPQRLHPQLETLVRVLRSPSALPPPVKPGPAGECEGWLAQLEDGYTKLTSMLDDLTAYELREQTLRNDRDFELESFDLVYGEALDFVRSVFQLGGLHEKVTWHLLPTRQQRKLRRKARQESTARAEGSRAKRTLG